VRFFARFILLAAGFALFTFGLLSWSRTGFSLTGLLPFTGNFELQGMHYVMLGVAMIPPSLWEIFNLERRAQHLASTPESAQESAPETELTDDA